MLPNPNDFVAALAEPFVGEKIFDQFSDLIYFVKDAQGRYLSVNRSLVERCGAKAKQDLVGRTVADIYSNRHGDHFLKQDLEVVRTGRPLIDELELHPYSRGGDGWCLTSKLPLHDQDGRTVGLVGTSRDLHSVEESSDIYESVAVVIDHVKKHLDDPRKAADLAGLAGVSLRQLDQRVKDVFGITTAQLVLQIRLNAAATALKETGMPIIQVAMAVGYRDQSAFARQFRKAFGMSPSLYRSSAAKKKAKASRNLPIRCEGDSLGR